MSMNEKRIDFKKNLGNWLGTNGSRRDAYMKEACVIQAILKQLGLYERQGTWRIYGHSKGGAVGHLLALKFLGSRTHRGYSVYGTTVGESMWMTDTDRKNQCGFQHFSWRCVMARKDIVSRISSVSCKDCRLYADYEYHPENPRDEILPPEAIIIPAVDIQAQSIDEIIRGIEAHMLKNFINQNLTPASSRDRLTYPLDSDKKESSSALLDCFRKFFSGK